MQPKKVYPVIMILKLGLQGLVLENNGKEAAGVAHQTPDLEIISLKLHYHCIFKEHIHSASYLLLWEI